MKNEKKILTKFATGLYITFFCLIIFQGCGTKEAVKNQTEEDFLRERVSAYWEHKIKQEFDKSYGFEAPLYRKNVTLVNYIRNFNLDVVGWTKAMVTNIKVDNDSAEVDLDLRVRVRLPEIRTPHEYNSPIKERWVKVDGMWYHVPAVL